VRGFVGHERVAQAEPHRPQSLIAALPVGSELLFDLLHEAGALLRSSSRIELACGPIGPSFAARVTCTIMPASNFSNCPSTTAGWRPPSRCARAPAPRSVRNASPTASRGSRHHSSASVASGLDRTWASSAASCPASFGGRLPPPRRGVTSPVAARRSSAL
jgi:hypothetical protein